MAEHWIKEAHMSKRTLGIILVVLGLVLALVAIFVDKLGLGPTPGFGWKQTLVLVVGALVAVGGVWWGWIKK